MGFGDFGSNRSVHWRIVEGELPNPELMVQRPDRTRRHPQDSSKDERLPVIGGAQHPGFIRVTARFLNNAAAHAALNQASKALGSGATVTLDVPIRDIRDTPFDPPEVTVDW